MNILKRCRNDESIEMKSQKAIREMTTKSYEIEELAKYLMMAKTKAINTRYDLLGYVGGELIEELTFEHTFKNIITRIVVTFTGNFDCRNFFCCHVKRKRKDIFAKWRDAELLFEKSIFD